MLLTWPKQYPTLSNDVLDIFKMVEVRVLGGVAHKVELQLQKQKYIIFL